LETRYQAKKGHGLPSFYRINDTRHGRRTILMGWRNLISFHNSFTFNKMSNVAAIYLRLLAVAVLLFDFAACGPPLLNIAPSVDNSLKEMRLGESNYYVSIPESYQLTEARGKEGQLGYNLMAREGEPGAYGFIEIRRGFPIGVGTNDTAKKFAVSKLDDRNVEWFIEQTEAGYFMAFTQESGDLNARASSKQLHEVETMIAIIATLKQK
jgi:hypothetical protein